MQHSPHSRARQAQAAASNSHPERELTSSSKTGQEMFPRDAGRRLDAVQTPLPQPSLWEKSPASPAPTSQGKQEPGKGEPRCCLVLGHP